MPLDSTTGLKDSRPKIVVGGQEIPSLAGGLLGLLIVEKTGGLYRCEARFGNWGPIDNGTGFLYFDRRTLDFGKDLQIKLGQSVIFEGKIMALEASFPEGQSPEITVLAEDRLQDLRMTRRTRTFADVSDADIFKQIASDHSLTPSIDASGPTHKVLAQVNQSDLAFMRERARALDADIWVDGRTLNVKTHANRTGETLKLKHGGQLREFTVIADLAMQRTSVTANGWDVASKSALGYEASASVISSELGGDTSGVSILQSAFGARKETLAHTVPLSSQDAQFEAEAFFKMCARRFVAGRGVAETDAKLRVGNHVE